MSRVELALLALQGLLGVAMVGAGGTKLVGTETHVEDFERFGYPQWFRVVTGSLEFLGALGLLVAFVTTDTFALAGGILVVVVLVGAIATHVKASDSLPEALPATALLVLALVVTWNYVGIVS
ncbi:DoxX family protein [Halomicrococcus sp. SG-WS-1]|uniref:DoxX family protein n=1 Tax=Halomicrococcus sp. SG-WS-1 TaxID=3439057 RepID=UPI003F7A2C1E